MKVKEIRGRKKKKLGERGAVVGGD